MIKGARWPLLRNRTDLAPPVGRVRLRELPAANRAMVIVYVLKDDLKMAYGYRGDRYVFLKSAPRVPEFHDEPLLLTKRTNPATCVTLCPAAARAAVFVVSAFSASHMSVSASPTWPGYTKDGAITATNAGAPLAMVA